MKNWILAALAAGYCVSARGHDGGVSELSACTADEVTTVIWKLHDVKKPNGDWLLLASNHQVMKPASFQVSGHHHAQLSWQFDAAEFEAELVLTLPGLDQLPYGHRVLASNCDKSRRAVLSQWHKHWTMAGQARVHAGSEKDRVTDTDQLTLSR